MFKKLKDFNPILIFEFVSNQTEKLNKVLVLILEKIASSLDKIGEAISSFALRKGVYKFFRLTSFPWHFIVIIVWKRILNAQKKGLLVYDAPGLHIIFGVPGSGKSSLAYELIERIRLKTKMKPSYINYPFEKVRLSEDKKYYYKYHQIYSMNDFFGNGVIKQLFNHKLFGSVVIDEAHTVFQPRNNRSRDYNDIFLPLVEYTTKIRQYIGHMFALTQMGRMDIQFMMLATTLTEVEIDIGFDYPEWLLKDGRFRVKPLGWNVKQYKIDSFGNFSTQPVNAFYVKNEYADFDYFDTYATRGDYSHVRMDYPTNYKKTKVKGSVY